MSSVLITPSIPEKVKVRDGVWASTGSFPLVHIHDVRGSRCSVHSVGVVVLCAWVELQRSTLIENSTRYRSTKCRGEGGGVVDRVRLYKKV